MKAKVAQQSPEVARYSNKAMIWRDFLELSRVIKRVSRDFLGLSHDFEEASRESPEEFYLMFTFINFKLEDKKALYISHVKNFFLLSLFV